MMPNIKFKIQKRSAPPHHAPTQRGSNEEIPSFKKNYNYLVLSFGVFNLIESKFKYET